MDLQRYTNAYECAVLKISELTKRNNSEEYMRNQLWKDYGELNLDPDGKAVRYVKDIKCTADGILSMKRICTLEPEVSNMVDVYKIYRKAPIFFFPSENGGINQLRATLLGDKIDWTLYDLKKYYSSERDRCVLINAYKREKTAKWLDEIGSFDNLIDWFGVKNVFTDNEYYVIDLENGKSIVDMEKGFSKDWSQCYYLNFVKKSIEKFDPNKITDMVSSNSIIAKIFSNSV